MISLKVAAALIAILAHSSCAYSRGGNLDDTDGFGGRQLLAENSVDVLASDDAVIYQTVSRTTGNILQFPSQSGWAVSNFTASLELDTNASYANNFMVDQPGTWMPGKTRFNLTANLTRTSGYSGNYYAPQLSAKLHTVTCQSDALETSFLADSSDGNTTESSAAALGLQFSNTSTTVANSTEYNFLVDYDEVASVVIYGNTQIMACMDLRPPFPDFPSDWSSTIEITDSQRGATFVKQETYSQSLNKVREDLHAFGSDIIIITDPASSRQTFINPKNGSCGSSFSWRSNYLTQDDNTTLKTTAELLYFTNSSDFKYIPGFANIRGIPCEVWQARNITVSNRYINMTFDAEYYFPINQWLVSREDYHRMLKRVYLNGTRNGNSFETFFEYINFRPRNVYKTLFDVCAISPYGHNCNCTDALRKAAFSNITALVTDGDELSVGSSADAACAYGAPVPHGFISAQSGPYVGLTIIGMIGGGLITAAAMYLFYRKRVGVRMTDNLRHTKFVDAPGS